MTMRLTFVFGHFVRFLVIICLTTIGYGNASAEAEVDKGIPVLLADHKHRGKYKHKKYKKHYKYKHRDDDYYRYEPHQRDHYEVLPPRLPLPPLPKLPPLPPLPRLPG